MYNITNNLDNVPQHRVQVSDSDVFQIINSIIQIILYALGLFIQVKNISVEKKEKARTWKIHVSQAVMLTILFGFRIPFQAITHFIPFLSFHVGSWICHIGSFIEFYGYQAIIAYSLWIALSKYILIVHAIKARIFGNDKIEEIFFWIHLISPIILAILAMLTTDYQARADLKSCYGIPDIHFDTNITSSVAAKIGKYLFCNARNGPMDYWIDPHLRQSLCLSRATINTLVGNNLFEGVLYFLIFRHMKK